MQTAGKSAASQPAPEFELETVQGKAINLDSAVKGEHDAVLLVFFFMGSDFCRAEIPRVQAVWDRYKEKGLTVVAVDIAPGEDRAAVKRYWDEQKLTVPVTCDVRSAAAGSGAQSTGGKQTPDLMKLYRVRNLPTHYIVGPNRRVFSEWVGYPLKTGAARLRSELAKAGYK